jgi:ubiquinone/menaquinone biosynthesis C-methylase UbiE
MIEKGRLIGTEGDLVKIDLGCGPNKKEGYLGIDILPLPGVDHVVNLEEGLSFLPDNSVDEFYTSHFLEHVDNFSLITREIYRTARKGATVKVIVPHHSNPYYYSDYTHKRFFGLYTFHYFSRDEKKYKRKVPRYDQEISFVIDNIKLIFRAPAFPLINLFNKHILQRIFNLHPYMQEVYEGLFTKIFSCYEIHYTLKVEK